ncbi:Uncharacterised protein [Acinetobacter baumannii]|uniref:hypothetical protein n=1 Tax=Acinetobacter baumannii TaxID=470 RepID=UPI000E122798|nr:hypothetical protein [Acinetobacter baumannii]SUV62954.1 Uncharacterised protein [Acinetobacter baumannii]
MNNSKLDFIQSVYEQQQKAEQLQMSLQQLSDRLINFEKLIEQSEQPIINGTTLLHKVQEKTTALELHLNSILTEIGSLSPQAIKTLTASYTVQIEELQAKLASIDITEISKVKSSIDSFFNINSGSTEQNQQPAAEHLDRSEEHPSPSPGPSTASDSQRKRADRERNTDADHGKTEYAKSKIHFMRDDLVWTADLFNSFFIWPIKPVQTRRPSKRNDKLFNRTQKQSRPKSII